MEYHFVKKRRTPLCSPCARQLQWWRGWTASPNTAEETREQAHEKTSALPTVETIALPGASHVPPVTHLAAYVEAIRKFIGTNPWP